MQFERIKLIRIQSGMTRDELAEKLGISSSALGNYERGEREPSSALIVALAGYFHVTSDYILGLSDTPNAAEEWPPTYPVSCTENIDIIKNAVYAMIKDVTLQQKYGWILFDILSDVVAELSGISEYVEMQRCELSKMHSDFQKFGDEVSRIFDGKHLRGALAEIQAKIDQHLELTAADNRTLDFDKHLRAAEDNIFEKLDSICRTIGDWLLNDAFDAIMGRSTKRVPPTPAQITLQNATPEQRKKFEDARKIAQEFLSSDLNGIEQAEGETSGAKEKQPPGE